MTEPQSKNTHEVISELFRAMDTKIADRKAANFRPWAEQFPYVNGSLFAGKTNSPRFTKMARSYLLRAGELDWKEINPDIFGSMIQAIAEDDKRGSLGMHYTSVPNILKVLDPLFLDDLRAQLEAAADNVRKLKNLRRRIASIRVFDPACGSGNFLVIAYIRMREIEHEIVKRLSEKLETQIKLENFYGIEIRSFPVEIAKLSLLIAEFQCNVRFYGEDVAWRHIPQASAFPPDTLGGPTGRLALDENVLGQDGSETYICGNPPYSGSKWQSAGQRSDVARVFSAQAKNFKTLDYVACWLFKGANYVTQASGCVGFVTTNSICQGEQVALLWPLIFALNLHITFAHRSFKWSNLATQNAGVTCLVVGFGRPNNRRKFIFEGDEARAVTSIGPYLLEMGDIIVKKRTTPISTLPAMQFGNHPYYASELILSNPEATTLATREPRIHPFLRPLYGSEEFVTSEPRTCIWIRDEDASSASELSELANRLEKVRLRRLAVKDDAAAQKLANQPHRFRDQITADKHIIIVPRVSSENRPYLPVGLLSRECILQDRAFGIFDGPLFALALVASRLHWVWIGTVCVRLEMRFSYSNRLGWNTFPVPTLTQKNKADLTRCAEDILIAREEHFPATIADLYDPDTMPDDLRRAHEQNDETLERIYIGRRFRNDTERLEKLFELYTKMVEAKDAKAKAPKKGTPN